MENPEHLRNKIDVFHQPEIKHMYIEKYTLTKVKTKKKKDQEKYLQHIGQNKMLPILCNSIDRYRLPCVKVILTGKRSIAQESQFGGL